LLFMRCSKSRETFKLALIGVTAVTLRKKIGHYRARSVRIKKGFGSRYLYAIVRLFNISHVKTVEGCPCIFYTYLFLMFPNCNLRMLGPRS
jgi:hypothetical protein